MHLWEHFGRTDKIALITFRVAKTLFLENPGFVWGTPAIFVIFVGFWALRSATPCFCGWNVNRHFPHFSSKPPVFGRGQKHRFPKTPFSQPWNVSQKFKRIRRFSELRKKASIFLISMLKPSSQQLIVASPALQKNFVNPKIPKNLLRLFLTSLISGGYLKTPSENTL